MISVGLTLSKLGLRSSQDFLANPMGKFDTCRVGCSLDQFTIGLGEASLDDYALGLPFRQLRPAFRILLHAQRL